MVLFEPGANLEYMKDCMDYKGFRVTVLKAAFPQNLALS